MKKYIWSLVKKDNNNYYIMYDTNLINVLFNRIVFGGKIKKELTTETINYDESKYELEFYR